MSVPTSAELALLRSRPQSTRLYLSIYEPKTILAARVATGTHYPGDENIVYDTVSTGSFSGVVSGQTMLVGTSAGDFDKGRIRVKSANATGIHVAPNMDINWQTGDYLKIINLHEVWSKYAKISPDLDADDDIIIIKDGDIYYSDQNSILGSLMVMGGNYAGFVEDAVYYSASGTFNVQGNQNLSYLWTFEGGNPTGSTVQEPGYVSYATPGHYMTTLRVSNVSGTPTDYGYRHISIYNRSTKKPIQQWGVDNLSGSRDGGGYTADIWVKDALGTLLEGSIVTIFAESIYGTTETEIGGNSKNRASVIFSGYIVDGSLVYDYETSSTRFTVVSTTEIMKRRDGLSLSVDSVLTPSKWQQIPNLNISKAIYHYLKWHSTVTEVSDVKYSGLDYPVQFLETDMESLYDGLESYLENRVDGMMVSDRQNTLFIESGIRLNHNANSTLPLSLTIRKQDWVGEPEIEFIGTNPVSYVDLGGFAYLGPIAATGTSTTMLADSPGSIKSYTGSPESGPQGLVLTSQAELNQMAGDYFAYQNARYPNVTMKMSSTFLNMDIAPYERYLLNMSASDTNRGIVFVNKPFHITEISWEYDPANMSLLPEINLHEITQGFPGQSIAVPVPELPSYPDDPYIPPYLPPFDPTIIPEVPPYVPPEVPDEANCRLGTVQTGPYALASLGAFALHDNQASDVGAVINSMLPCWIRRNNASFTTYLILKAAFDNWVTSAVFPFKTYTPKVNNNNPLVIKAYKDLNTYISGYISWLQTPADHGGIGIVQVMFLPTNGFDTSWFNVKVVSTGEDTFEEIDRWAESGGNTMGGSFSRNATEGHDAPGCLSIYHPGGNGVYLVEKFISEQVIPGQVISVYRRNSVPSGTIRPETIIKITFEDGHLESSIHVPAADGSWSADSITVPAGLATYQVTKVQLGMNSVGLAGLASHTYYFDDLVIGTSGPEHNRVSIQEAKLYNVCARSY